MSDLLNIVRNINRNNGRDIGPLDADNPRQLMEPMFCLDLCRDGFKWRVAIIMAQPDDDSVVSPIYAHEHLFDERDDADALRDKIRRFAVTEYSDEWIGLSIYLEDSPHWRRGDVSPDVWHRRQRIWIDELHAEPA